MSDSQRGQFVARVQANVPLCREHYRLVLSLPAFPETEPGQFVQVSCRDLGADVFVDRELEWPLTAPLARQDEELASPSAYLRRPFSLAGRRDLADGVELDLIHRVVGVGTDWLSKLDPGDSVHLLGPLGNRFRLPEPRETALLVGGGVGIPPMLYLAEKLAGRSVVAFCGALTRDLLPLKLIDGPFASPDAVNPRPIVEEFARHLIHSVISTDDGTFGFRGFVTQALEKFLDEHAMLKQPSVATEASPWVGGNAHKNPTDLRPWLPQDARRSGASTRFFVIYTCGPEPMMKRVADIAAARGIPCQIAVERAMACGMGTCQSCCIRLKDAASPQGWRYRLACTDGPVFAGSELLW